MFEDGQELDVREAHLGGILGQPRGGFTVSHEPISLLGNTHPGAKVHLVDRDRRGDRLAVATAGHPRTVAPLVE